jgi:hypothetical protein
MGKNADFVTRMDMQLTRWDKEVDALARLAGNGGAVVGEVYHEGVKELREVRDAAQAAFQQIRFASEAEGLELKAGMQAAWVKMQSTLEKVSATVVRTPQRLR